MGNEFDSMISFTFVAAAVGWGHARLSLNCLVYTLRNEDVTRMAPSRTPRGWPRAVGNISCHDETICS